MHFAPDGQIVKKLIVGEKWKRHLKARSRYEEKARKRFRSHREERRVLALRSTFGEPFRKTVRLEAPQVFSLIGNPDETIGFLNNIISTARHHKNVSVDLSAVETITPDAVAALLATIDWRNMGRAQVSGNVPRQEAAKEFLENSDFRRSVHSVGGYIRKRQMGKIIKSTSGRETINSRFHQEFAQQLIEFATSTLTANKRRFHPPSYSVLGEAMLNTFNHAAGPNESRRPWYASVYLDLARRRACFTFIDQGVGIFKSHDFAARWRMRFKLGSLLSLPNNANLLQRLFHGEMPSRVKEPGRGNGIPGMYEHCVAKRIRNFSVIANDALGQAEIEQYRLLAKPFGGTILYWEVEYEGDAEA
jgi:hypothetical protein